MNLRQIEVFRAVMRAGSISGAAAALHVSQPAVSRLIRYLEVKLQVQLFERSGGRLHATPEARALLREIDGAYRGIDRVRAFAEQLRHGVADTLRIATNLSTALELVPRAVAALKHRKPRLHVAVEVGTHAQITDWLLAGECDIGVAAFVQTQHPAVTATVIGEGEVLCATAASHPLAGSKRVTLEALRRHDMISFGSESAHGRIVRGVIGGELPVEPTVEVRYAYVACSIAASGWGLALVDDLTASRFQDGSLALRRLAQPVRYQSCAMSSAERPLSAAGREMVKLLQSEWQAMRAGLAAQRAARA